jgi:hypothetical protein
LTCSATLCRPTGAGAGVPSTWRASKTATKSACWWRSDGTTSASPALFASREPTLRKHYFSELKFRDVARDRLDAGLAMKLWDQVQAGNVGAMKEFRKLLDRNDLMPTARLRARTASRKPKAPKLGKKDEALPRRRCPIPARRSAN